MASDNQSQFANPANWSSFYSDLKTRGHIPDASSTILGRSNAIFRDMYQDLAVIQERIRQSGYTPLMTTIYADVLVVPDLTNWLLQSSAVIIFARRIEVSGNASVILNYAQTNTAQFIVFANEMGGTLNVLASSGSQEQPVVFHLTQDNVAPGISINSNSGKPGIQPLTLAQGIGFQLPEDMQLYLNNAFIYGSLLYDQNPPLALSIFLWTKAWAAESKMEELFFRSTSLVTLLGSEINAAANGAVFVPYLSTSVYTSLAGAFASEAAAFEDKYLQLSTQKLMTDEMIQLAKTMVENAQSEEQYVDALLQQANNNYDNAVIACKKAQANFSEQKTVVSEAAANFKNIGLPDFERDQILKAVFGLVSAILSFGAGIAEMAVGDEAAAPDVAKNAVKSVKAVADAAGTGAAVAKKASNLAEIMKKLVKLLEGLEKVYKLAEAVKEVAENLTTASEKMKVIGEMEDTTEDTDLSAADGWAVYKIQTDDLLQAPIDKEIGFALEYREALDILVVYGQSVSASQLAVIKAGQEVSALIFQQHYTQQKQANLQNLVNGLKSGEAPLLLMMQQFYQKYLDGKSSLFAALKSYQASYFYWALRPSSVRPQIIDPVSTLNTGISNMTSLAMDSANALSRFDPPPQVMEHMVYEIIEPSIIKQLRATGQVTWVLPIDDPHFAGMERVRLNTIRVWLEGITLKQGDSVFVNVTTAGNYLDRYKGVNYQFNSKQLTRSFKYMVSAQGESPGWIFDDGRLGFVQIDGAVDKEVAFAYFQPTPFSEWSISLLSNNPGIDFSTVSKITMFMEGTVIPATAEARKVLIQKSSVYA